MVLDYCEVATMFGVEIIVLNAASITAQFISTYHISNVSYIIVYVYGLMSSGLYLKS